MYCVITEISYGPSSPSEYCFAYFESLAEARSYAAEQSDNTMLVEVLEGGVN